MPEFKGEPACKTIKEVERLLIENTASTQSILGGGNHRYLGLILSPAKCLTVAGYNYEGHTNPSALLMFLVNAAQHQIPQENTACKDQLQLWQEETAMKALKN